MVTLRVYYSLINFEGVTSTSSATNVPPPLPLLAFAVYSTILLHHVCTLRATHFDSHISFLAYLLPLLWIFIVGTLAKITITIDYERIKTALVVVLKIIFLFSK